MGGRIDSPGKAGDDGIAGTPDVPRDHGCEFRAGNRTVARADNADGFAAFDGKIDAVQHLVAPTAEKAATAIGDFDTLGDQKILSHHMIPISARNWSKIACGTGSRPAVGLS